MYTKRVFRYIETKFQMGNPIFYYTPDHVLIVMFVFITRFFIFDSEIVICRWAVTYW